jgi:hypothetical protein
MKRYWKYHYNNNGEIVGKTIENINYSNPSELISISSSMDFGGWLPDIELEEMLDKAKYNFCNEKDMPNYLGK